MDPDRLLRLHRPHLRARNALVLWTRAALGQRRTDRNAPLTSRLAHIARDRLKGAVDGLLAVVLAPPCAACGRILDEPTRGGVCPACWRSIQPITPPVCDRCGDPLPMWRVISVAVAL